MSKTKIEWTEKSWNPVTGCDKVSAGCKNCYAETIANRFWVGRKFTDVICHDSRLEIPLHWRKPQMVFVNSMSDLFHEKVPFEFIEKVWSIMAKTPQHTYQILTKRPEMILEWNKYRSIGWNKLGFDIKPNEFFTPNVWLGVSVENQEQANKRIPLLLQIPAAVRWLSVEPMLGEVDLKHIQKVGVEDVCTDYLNGLKYRADYDYAEADNWGKLHWVVCGAESGAGARPMKIEWAESLLEQCKQAGVPFFMKQLCHKGRKLKFEDWPKHLQVREYPGSN